jgi:hypothetical protein
MKISSALCRESPVLLVVLLISLAACENSGLVDASVHHINFEIVTLDKKQEENVSFDAGEDIGIGLKIINASDDAIEWSYDYTCMLFQNSDFLIVHKRNDGIETQSSFLSLGTPYEPPIYCLAIIFPPEIISRGEKLLINLPWSTNRHNQPLSEGQYVITAKFEINIKDQRKALDLRHDFEMK